MPSRIVSAIDLFAGAGGFSLGLEQAGIEVVGSIEADRFAAETYSHNFPTVPLFQRTVESCTNTWIKSNFSGIDLIAGGPPCQGFSVAGPSQYRRIDIRNSLIMEMARFACLLRPRFIVLENVRGILSGQTTNGAGALSLYLDALGKCDYHSEIVRLQAVDFGVPQWRERVFIISGRGKEHSPLNFIRRLRALKKRQRTVYEAISDLPSLRAGEGFNEGVPYAIKPQTGLQRELRVGSNGSVTNHVAMRHSERVLERIAKMSPGDSMKTVPPEHGQRTRNSHIVDGRGRYKMNYSRLYPDGPSIAVTANFQTIHVHPNENRMLTAREGARLQSFPDHFIFKGPRTLPSRKLLEREGRQDEIGLSQYNQIGNAVPPFVSRAIGLLLRETLT